MTATPKRDEEADMSGTLKLARLAVVVAICAAGTTGIALAQRAGGSEATDTAAQNRANSESSTTSSASTNASPTLSKADREFMEKAASGGLSEVQGGRLAAQQGENAQIKSFGEHMVKDHSAANDKLMALAQSKQIELPSTPDQSDTAKLDKLKGLSGAAFDKKYAEMMVKDHKHDVAEFEKAAKSAKDPNLKAFAQATLPTLRTHLTMAESLPGESSGATSDNPNPNRHSASAADRDPRSNTPTQR
jgi:putative membrane protein